jgi:hypothetical protein
MSIIGLAVLLSACESGSSTTGGGTTERRSVVNLDTRDSSAESSEDSSTDSATESASKSTAQTSTVAAAPAPAAVKSTNRARRNVHLTFKQTVQACSSCGIWFDSMQMVIEYAGGTYTSPTKSGRLLVKKSSGLQQNFSADLSSIPAGATIQRATLYMRLNTHEGLAGSDNGSVLAVYDGGKHVRNITASGDMKGRGYSKSNPNVPIDFTAYVNSL